MGIAGFITALAASAISLSYTEKEGHMGIAGFITALAASAISLIISFIPVQLNNILAALFLVILSVMCYMMPQRTSLKGCLIGCSILFVVFRFVYMSLIGRVLYIILAAAIIAGAIMMNTGNQNTTTGGKTA